MNKEDWEKLVYETMPSKIADEWVKKYKNTYVFVKDTLVYASGYDGKFFTFVDETSQVYKMLCESKTMITPKFPDIGAFTYGTQFCIFNRLPARQYKKAPHQDNCLVFNPIAIARGKAFLSLNFTTLQAAFDGGFLAPHTLCEAIFKGVRSGGAISSLWAMEKHPSKSDTILLFFQEYPVAEITKKGVANVVVPSFIQEVQDFNRDFAVGLVIA